MLTSFEQQCAFEAVLKARELLQAGEPERALLHLNVAALLLEEEDTDGGE